jgi:hypothetical protein
MHVQLRVNEVSLTFLRHGGNSEPMAKGKITV